MYKTTLKIDGMMCGMCESHINDTIRKAVPVKMSAPPPYRKPRPVPMPAGRGFLCAALQTKTAMAADCHGGFVFWKAQKVATLCSAGSAG